MENLFLKNPRGKVETINVDRECKVINFPTSKQGDFMLKVTEDISRTFNGSYMGLYDYSTIKIGRHNISLPLYYIKKYGYTYYMKYGYKPVIIDGKENDLIANMLQGIDIEYDDEVIEMLIKKIKKN